MADIMASPKGEKVRIGRKSFAACTYAEALARAQPGDVVRLAKGEYEPIKDARLATDGSRDRPITVSGEDGAEFVGKKKIDFTDPNDPLVTGPPALTIAADWVVLEHLKFAHCWPHAVVLKGCRDIVIRDCSGTQSRRLIWAMNSEEGAAPRVLTERILLERVRWTQDPEHLLWSGQIEWCQVKQDNETGECAKSFLSPDRSLLNGAMFGSRDIYGNVTIRQCRVEHAFNAIRMDTHARDNGSKPSNVNVQIYDNDFAYIRDNVTEPEGYAVNVWIHHNRLRNTYAPFSFDDIWGGYWYVFANTVWTDEPLSGADDGHDWGQCFKFHNEAMPRWPVYSFHNSIHTPWPYTKEGMTRHWSDYNNAVEFMRGGNPSGEIAPYFKTPRQYFRWDPSYQSPDADEPPHLSGRSGPRRLCGVGTAKRLRLYRRR